ncbi:TonB-dependent receptor plug domain-containing protein [Tenacibaculum sp. SG-28]|uniref:TonB-dependent receptor plug domain-containing protein n=1 Tax=Tenacibaculum sp. SG-28 TaxID=754426 RepID=UPI000CF4DFDD|nr:TonB-dependent receptor plug domain-containing protein [Tenacibaculum sp. SG-28]PQJ20676.1 hypothetical protein BSU00_10260 [Tenacibaculum sp. SG-28]
MDEDELNKKRREERNEENALMALEGFNHASLQGSYLLDKDIRPSDIFFSDLMRRIPGIFVSGSRVNASFRLVRSLNSSISSPASDPLFILDGGIISDLNFLSPQRIKAVYVLKGLSASIRYGSAGANGVIVVRTKSGFANKTKNGNSALVSGNEYEETVPLLEDVFQQSVYINGLLDTENFDVAHSLYLRAKEDNRSFSVPFYLDVANHFMQWNKDTAYQVLSNIAEIAYDNPKALKTLAFKLEEIGKLKEATHIYERILELLPNELQSYRDLAVLYDLTGAHEQAMVLYKKLLSNTSLDSGMIEFQRAIKNEVRHLLMSHKSEVNFQNLPDDIFDKKLDNDFRIVFEWNDKNIEFEVQFVDPNKKYFTWNHSFLENREKLLQEVSSGIYMEEFIIDKASAPEGEWIINITSLSKESDINPVFLKYTIYQNYGLPHQTKEIKIVNLNNQKEKITIDKIVY